MRCIGLQNMFDSGDIMSAKTFDPFTHAICSALGMLPVKFRSLFKFCVCFLTHHLPDFLPAFGVTW
jgi:hypothetical protein